MMMHAISLPLQGGELGWGSLLLLLHGREKEAPTQPSPLQGEGFYGAHQ
jgi:hypothetical protein